MQSEGFMTIVHDGPKLEVRASIISKQHLDVFIQALQRHLDFPFGEHLELTATEVTSD